MSRRVIRMEFEQTGTVPQEVEEVLSDALSDQAVPVERREEQKLDLVAIARELGIESLDVERVTTKVRPTSQGSSGQFAHYVIDFTLQVGADVTAAALFGLCERFFPEALKRRLATGSLNQVGLTTEIIEPTPPIADLDALERRINLSPHENPLHSSE